MASSGSECVYGHFCRPGLMYIKKALMLETLQNPHLTLMQLMMALKEHNITVSIGTIKNIWKEEKLNTRELRIKRSQSLNIEV